MDEYPMNAIEANGKQGVKTSEQPGLDQFNFRWFQ
jgi:hypothetical protein